ncbi:hypothetical protein OIDMADRAFT_51206 [Oidiodendron maius Zn]|uniref:BZIP domain-containing protein n=1 Tax=Oidiodendron maius (strain Zn) TaxID=913774 RepID=A0A0C3D2B1_OIDMZ|nr:hypothetical protein OIDMADRAFT_51206 [Oidiodendron maius Zn]
MSNSSSHTGSSSNSERDKRRTLNRLAQRAFRRRQAETLRELKTRADAGQTSNGDVVAALKQENSLLRKQLTETQGQLERIQATLQLMTGSITKALDKRQASITKDYRESQELHPAEGVETPCATSVIPGDDCQTLHDNTTTQLCIGHYTPGTDDSSSASLCQQIPNTWMFQYQMGPQVYDDCLSANRQSSSALGQDWVDSNSPFSDHVRVLKGLLKSKLNQTALMMSLPQLLYQPVSMVLAMFNSITRPDVMAWYVHTRFYHIIELTAWQLSPSPTTFSKLHERYRQTDIQMKFHDRYPSNPRIDQVFCDAVSAYVVETFLSDLIIGGPPVTAYIRVTDLIQAMSLFPEVDDLGLTATLPIFDVSTIFTSPQHALLVFKLLKMDRGVSQYKIDPAFFGKYPELYHPGMDGMIASGIPLKPDIQTTLTCPKPLDNLTVGTYRSFINFSFDAAAQIINNKEMCGELVL